MKIDLADGVLIEGDAQELRDLADELKHAAKHGHSEGIILTDDGVETVTIRTVSDG
jgi:hypothetical protein